MQSGILEEALRSATNSNGLSVMPKYIKFAVSMLRGTGELLSTLDVTKQDAY